MERSLSVIIPALNEEKKIKSAIDTVVQVLEKSQIDYELLAFNDGSRDHTGKILDNLALNNFRIKVIHHPTNRGLGVIAREGFVLATKRYLTWFSGDNSIQPLTFEQIINSVGKADIIIAYMSNINQRPLLRKILTHTFTLIQNITFGLNIKYYNGPSVYPVELVRKVNVSSYGYDFYAELLIRSIKTGATYKQVPFTHKIENEKNSKALSWRNLKNVFLTYFTLIKDIYILRKPEGLLEIKSSYVKSAF